MTELAIGLVQNAEGIVAGPDGALWFTEIAAVGRITTAGAVTHVSVPGGPPRSRSARTGISG